MAPADQSLVEVVGFREWICVKSAVRASFPVPTSSINIAKSGLKRGGLFQQI